MGTIHYCPNCGEKLDRKYVMCPSCGEMLNHSKDAYTPQAPRQTQVPRGSKESGALYGVLGFLVPIAGLVIFLVWREERPEAAKAAGIGALASLVVPVLAFMFFITMAIPIAGLYA